jgi:hypothetical protein
MGLQFGVKGLTQANVSLAKENLTAVVDGSQWLVGDRPAASPVTNALPGVESLPPGAGSAPGPKIFARSSRVTSSTLAPVSSLKAPTTT